MNAASDAIRRWRWPTALVLGILAAGTVIALLQPSGSGYLDPRGTDAQGGHALADLLAGRGQQVIRTTAPGGDGDLELVTSPDALSASQLTQLARFRGDLLVVDPDAAALAALAPAVRLAGVGPGAAVPPRCTAQPAVLAGDADLGGTLLASHDPAAELCYPNGGAYSLIQYTAGSRMITVLGSGTPLTNASLADRGDAALALNLLRSAHRVLWLVPPATPAAAASAAGGGGQQSFFSLVPRPVYLIAFQLAVAALLAAGWRARRLGPVVAEKLPVVVRASETVEGHGRLYQARRARDTAAAALRAATRRRLARLTGQPDISEMSAPSGDPGGGLAAVVAERTGRDSEAVAALFYGPAPASDAALVALASDLDTLEREVLRR